MARFRVTQWNADALVARAATVLEEFGPQVAAQAREEIERVQYPYLNSSGEPVITRRKSGEIAKSPRNIVDTGFLRDSATAPEVTASGPRSVLQIAWTAPYAYEVLKGGYLVGTTRNNYIAPERDWISRTYRQLAPGGERPLLPFLVRRWNQLASGT